MFDAQEYLAELRRVADTTPKTAAVPHEDIRIRDLPWKDYGAQAFVDYAMSWATERWSRGPDCPMQFRPIQAVALLVIHLTGGALLPIGTGHGKTLLLLLAASALQGNRRAPVLLIPPSMRREVDNLRAEYNQSFKIPTNLRIMAYSQLSVASSTAWLEQNAPGAIIADEGHNLRHLDSARTRRVERYMKKHPDTPCVFMSGTLTSKSLRDYAHLSQWALKGNSPLPLLNYFTYLQSWCAILDAKPVKVTGNTRFVAEASNADFCRMNALFPDYLDYEGEERVSRARALFQQRLAHAPGVVATSTASVGANLWLVRREVETPQEVLDHIQMVEDRWQRPDGEELQDAPAKWRCGRQLAQGFYYRWVWPGGEPDHDWLTTRAQWHKAVRAVCERSLPHLDSPMLVGQQVHYALAGKDSLVATYEGLLDAYRDWEPHSRKRWGSSHTPPTETVWVSDYLVKDAVAWWRAGKARFVWYEEHAIEDALARAGLPIFGRGTQPQDIRGAHGAALSLHCHKDGKNLQYGHHEMLYMSVSPSGTIMEQSLSRTHRSGQTEDDVYAYYYDNTEPSKAALASAVSTSRYQQETTGSPYRLCYCKWAEEKNLTDGNE